MTCDLCTRLFDKPTTIGPSQSLVLRDTRLGERGAVESYKCGGCGTQWHRFKGGSGIQGKGSNLARHTELTVARLVFPTSCFELHAARAHLVAH